MFIVARGLKFCARKIVLGIIQKQFSVFQSTLFCKLRTLLKLLFDIASISLFDKQLKLKGNSIKVE